MNDSHNGRLEGGVGARGWREVSGAVFGRVTDDVTLREALLGARLPRARRYLIKTSWYTPSFGTYTEAASVDLLLSALPAESEKVVIESYAAGRNDGSRRITPKNTDEHRDWIREQDEWFLDWTGIGDVLRRHRAQYFNLTEAWWRGETAPEGEVRRRVEEAYGPLTHPELYGVLPRTLWEWSRDGETVLVDFGKVKVGTDSDDGQFSLSIKNIFGCIPNPARFDYHRTLPESILDINKVYRAHFPVFGALEGLQHVILYRESGAYRVPWGRYDVADGEGLVVLGNDPVALDVVAAWLYRHDIRGRTLMKLATAEPPLGAAPTPEALDALPNLYEAATIMTAPSGAIFTT